MTYNEKEFPTYVLSRHLSLASMLAGAFSEGKGRHCIEVADFIVGCYIADPVRFVGFWSDSATCIENLARECGLEDPAWACQQSLTDTLRIKAEKYGNWRDRNSSDLHDLLSRAAASAPEIDLPHFLLVARSDLSLTKLFTQGFRQDLAIKLSNMPNLSFSPEG